VPGNRDKGTAQLKRITKCGKVGKDGGLLANYSGYNCAEALWLFTVADYKCYNCYSEKITEVAHVEDSWYLIQRDTTRVTYPYPFDTTKCFPEHVSHTLIAQGRKYQTGLGCDIRQQHFGKHPKRLVFRPSGRTNVPAYIMQGPLGLQTLEVVSRKRHSDDERESKILSSEARSPSNNAHLISNSQHDVAK
jgi:hypothetical protein